MAGGLTPERLEAFTRRDLQTAIQLYRHLTKLRNTFEDLIEFMRYQREIDRVNPPPVVSERTRRKHLKKGGGKWSREYDNS